MHIVDLVVFALFASTLSCVFFAERLVSRRIRRPSSFRAWVAIACSAGLALSGASAVLAASPWLVRRPWLAGLAHIACLAIFAALVALTLQRWISKQAVTEPRRILAIGAHPDDLELACGGTLAKFADAGHTIHALVLSNGEVGGEADRRALQASKGARYMGTSSIAVHDLPDTALEACANRLIQIIEKAIRTMRPDIILTHSANDQHQDHFAVHQATLRAARQHSTILCYESPSTTRAFAPTFFVDIEDHLDVKIRAVKTHADQVGKPYMSAERVTGMASFRGGQSKARHAEAFELVRMSDESLRMA